VNRNMVHREESWDQKPSPGRSESEAEKAKGNPPSRGKPIHSKGKEVKTKLIQDATEKVEAFRKRTPKGLRRSYPLKAREGVSYKKEKRDRSEAVQKGWFGPEEKFQNVYWCRGPISEASEETATKGQRLNLGKRSDPSQDKTFGKSTTSTYKTQRERHAGTQSIGAQIPSRKK